MLPLHPFEEEAWATPWFEAWALKNESHWSTALDQRKAQDIVRRTLWDERAWMFCWDSTLSASGLTPDLVESLATEEQVTKVCDVLLLGPWVASAGSTLRPALDGEWHDSSLAYWAVGRTEWVSRFLGEPFRVSYFDLSVGVWNTTDGKHFEGFQLDDQKFSHGERGIFSALPWFSQGVESDRWPIWF